MLKVYLAGPISGLTQTEALGWRERTRALLEENRYECVDPMRGHDSRRAEEALRADGHNWPYGPKAVFKRDKHDVERCDIILVNLTAASRVSIFTMMEMAWAEQWNKFILTVMEDGNLHEHLAVREASSLVVPTLSEAIKYLTKVHNK